MNPIRTSNFRCGECSELYGNEEDALSCCAPEAEEVLCWKCTECGDESDDEESARYCCLDEDIVLACSMLMVLFLMPSMASNR